MTQPLADNLEREQRINEVLLEYVEAVQAGRIPDRRQLIAAHPEFRAELEEFFASHDAVERLAAPIRVAAEDSQSAPPSIQASNASAELGQLGDYRLIREVGRGGMGVVYEAEQISLRRRVALKVLPFAAAIDPRQLQRFQNEALAAAHLRHENVVPVYAVGSERGVHYYAMQFVEGQSLAALIAELRRGAGGQTAPAETTSPYFDAGMAPETRPADAPSQQAASISQERSSGGRRYYNWAAGLGRQAALALEHAHQMGIVHRDIKPANLLLDPRGQLWVADFGLAQFSNNAGLTVTGEVLGTLRYASPEQALALPGLVDHRSDIYSLGATLYELLTLQPIFDGRDRNELLRQIAHEEPALPRSIDRAIPVELETIVLKAIAKEPGERYATARELADDLQRFLDDLPIHARRPTVFEQATKWARRHRPMVASGLAALLLSLAGLSAATVLATRAYDRERLKAAEADEQRAKAEQGFRQARQTVDQFAQIGAVDLAGDPSLERARRMVLETALAYYQDFFDQSRGDPALQKEFEESRAKISLILDELTTGNWFDRYLILRRRDVHDELGLSPEQRQRIGHLEDQWLEAIRKSRELEPRARDQRRAALVGEQEVAVAAILKEDQRHRFRQIALQLSGPSAFSDPEVADVLQLTADQKRKIRDIQGETGFVGPMIGGPPGRRGGPGEGKRGGPPGGKRGGPGEGKRGRGGPLGPPDDWWRTQDEKVLEVLTKEQRERWKQLIGAEFQGGGGFGPREGGGHRGPPDGVPKQL